MAEIQKIIGQVAIFMICAQAITHFRPKEAYGKYLRLLLGVMILVQIFQPVYGLFLGTEEGDLQVSLEMFQEKLDTSMEEAAEQAILSENRLREMTMAEVQERLEQQEIAEQEGIGDKEGEALSEGTLTDKGGNTEIDTIQIDEMQVEIEVTP